MVKLGTLLARVLAEYLADVAAEENGTPNEGAGTYPYSPARATNAVAKRYGYPKSRLIPLAADVYYRENGERSPLPIRARKNGGYTERAIADAVRKRRDARGRLGRWEVIAYSLAATLGTPVSVPAVRAYYRLAGGDTDASYTGRGTRKGAPKTRTSETLEISASAATPRENGADVG